MYVVVYRFNTQGGGIKGQPVKRDGHYKVYGSRKAASSASYRQGRAHTEVAHISVTINNARANLPY